MARFQNLDPFPRRGLVDVLRWQLGSRRPDRKAHYDTPRRDNDGAVLASRAASLTWIGHSSFALRLGGLVVLTDPILVDRVGLHVRNVAPGLALERTPAIDVVCISHAHADHLDTRSIERIRRHNERLGRRPPLMMVPTGVGRYLPGLPRVELGWWEQHRMAEVEFTLVPQQHWSMRGPFDRDEALWGGWVLKGPEGTAYHAGDTGWFSHFGEIGRRVGPIDWAMLPIGAYDPAWFMSPQHMGPEEAGRAFLELGARNLVCMHWGTFQLTDEPLGEPVERIERWWQAEGPPDRERLWRMDIGESRAL